MLKCEKVYHGHVGDRFRWAMDTWRGSIYFNERADGTFMVETTDNKATSYVLNRIGRMFDKRCSGKQYPQWLGVTKDEADNIIRS